MVIQAYQDQDKSGLLALWEEIFPAGSPHNDPQISLENKLRVNRDLLFVAIKNEEVIGSVIGGYDGHRGWIYSLAVSPPLRRGGIASALMHVIEEKIKALGCLKLNIQVVASNDDVVALYKELGFSVEERISMGKRLY